MKQRRGTPGFILIELPAVMTILAALLLPTLPAAARPAALPSNRTRNGQAFGRTDKQSPGRAEQRVTFQGPDMIDHAGGM